MECHDVRLLLTFAQRGCEDLDAAERTALQHHLDQCPECANLAQAERSLDKALGQIMRDVTVPAGLKEKVLGRLESNRKGWPWRRIALGAVAAALLIGAGATLLFWQDDRPVVTAEVLEKFIYQGREYDAEQIEEYFAKQGLTIKAPVGLKYKDLQHIDVFEFQNRRVARLSFASADFAGDVLILPAAQFRIDALRDQQGFIKVEREGDFTYVIIMQRGAPDKLKLDLDA